MRIAVRGAVCPDHSTHRDRTCYNPQDPNERTIPTNSQRDEIQLIGGPADGARVRIDPGDYRVVVIVLPDGSGWCYEEDHRPRPSTGTRYYYRTSDGHLDEVHRYWR